MKRFKELGLTLEELRAMPPKAVEVAFYPPENLKRSEKPMHDLRHSYAVAAIQAGDDIKTVQANLGHATAAFTLDVYAHR